MPGRGRKWLIRAAVILALLWVVFVYRNRRGTLQITFEGIETNRNGGVEHIFKVQNDLADIEVSPFILTAGGEEFGIGKRDQVFKDIKSFPAGRYDIRDEEVSYHLIRYFTLSNAKIESSVGPHLRRGQTLALRCSQPIQPVSWVAGLWYTEPATPHRDRLAIWNNWLSTKFGVPSLVQSKATGGQLMSEIIAWRPLLPWASAVSSTNVLERGALTNE